MVVLCMVAHKNSLNEMQLLAYGLIANKFLQSVKFSYVEQGVTLVIDPLRLLLCGPGGTGKTHVIHSVQEVMKIYGCEHQLRLLAPTCNAAALIDGMTCHKGLGLKISATSSEYIKICPTNIQTNKTVSTTRILWSWKTRSTLL